jgi:signal transduction histidine kinase
MSKILETDSKISSLGTSNESGTGLGLMLSQEFIKLHESKLAIASKAKEGSRFSFCLPMR